MFINGDIFVESCHHGWKLKLINVQSYHSALLALCKYFWTELEQSRNVNYAHTRRGTVARSCSVLLAHALRSRSRRWRLCPLCYQWPPAIYIHAGQDGGGTDEVLLPVDIKRHFIQNRKRRQIHLYTWPYCVCICHATTVDVFFIPRVSTFFSYKMFTL